MWGAIATRQGEVLEMNQAKIDFLLPSSKLVSQWGEKGPEQGPTIVCASHHNEPSTAKGTA
jgi:hypothetical protein